MCVTRIARSLNWDKFVHCQVRANEVHAEVEHPFSSGSRDVLMNAQCTHKWWSTLNMAVSGLNHGSVMGLQLFHLRTFINARKEAVWLC